MKNSTRPGHFEIILSVSGMMCQKNCGSTVQRALSSVDGVLSCDVSFERQEAVVRGSASVADLIAAVDSVGFEAMLCEDIDAIKLEADGISGSPDLVLEVRGMKDPKRCPRKVTELITAVDGVLDVLVDFEAAIAQVWGFADLEPVREALQESGYTAEVCNGRQNRTGQRTEDASITSISYISCSDVCSSGDKVFTGEPVQLVLSVTGMSCASCSASIEDLLLRQRGVSQVRVALLLERVEVIIDPNNCQPEAVVDKVLSLGYTAMILSVTALKNLPTYMFVFHVLKSNVHFTNDRNDRVLRDIRSRPGVKRVSFDFELMNISVELLDYNDSDSDLGSECFGPRDVLDLLTSMGLVCELVDTTALHDSVSKESSELNSWWNLLLVAMLFGIPVTMLHLLQLYDPLLNTFLSQPVHDDNHVTIIQALQLTLNSPMQFFVGYKYYRAAYLGAVQGNFGMDCLVVTGTSITFAYSLTQIIFAYITSIRAKHVFFEASGMLLLFVTLGKYLEAHAKGKTASSITSLLQLQPKQVLALILFITLLYSYNSLA